MLLNQLEFHAPKTLDELVKLHAELENVKIQAGGTFLLNALKLLKRKGSRTPDHVISLNKVSDLKGIVLKDDELVIKSMTTIADLFDYRDLPDDLRVLKTVCRNISTQPIRNMASVGGNLTCRYTWTEMPAVCVGLGAKMHFIHKDQKEEVISAEEFFKNAAKTDGILTHISIPRKPNVSIAYQRVKKSQYVDIPMLSLLIKSTIEGGQLNDTVVAINNCVEFAQRDNTLENFLNQGACSDQLPEEALDHLEETIYDKRSNDYKKHMFRLSIKKAIQDLIQLNNSSSS